MAEARSREAWAHTASMLAMLANANRDPKKGRPFKPADFSPYPRKAREGAEEPERPMRADIRILKAVFVDGRQSP